MSTPTIEQPRVVPVPSADTDLGISLDEVVPCANCGAPAEWRAFLPACGHHLLMCTVCRRAVLAEWLKRRTRGRVWIEHRNCPVRNETIEWSTL